MPPSSVRAETQRRGTRKKENPVLGQGVTPNPSFERTSTGMSPRGAQVHDAPRGATPVASAQFKR
jgi:hypothetical protein